MRLINAETAEKKLAEYCGQRFDWKEFKKREQNDEYFNNRGEVDDD